MAAGVENIYFNLEGAVNNALLPASECSDKLISLMTNVDAHLRQLDTSDIDSAPHFSEAADTYGEEGFLIRSAALKRITASIYRNNDYPDLAALEVIDAIGLTRLGYRMARLGLGDLRQDAEIRRSAYPHMYLWDDDLRSIKVLGSPSGDTPGDTIYRFMRVCYMDLLQSIGHAGIAGATQATYKLWAQDMAMFPRIDAQVIERYEEVNIARIVSAFDKSPQPRWTEYADWCTTAEKYAKNY